MMYLDTHAAVWLYAGTLDRFSDEGKAAIEGTRDLRLSPMAMLELEYLREVGRIRATSSAIVSTLEQHLGLKVCDVDFRRVADRATKEAWTRDPFDRLIVAQAALNKAELLTKDRTIRKHYSRAIW